MQEELEALQMTLVDLENAQTGVMRNIEVRREEAEALKAEVDKQGGKQERAFGSMIKLLKAHHRDEGVPLANRTHAEKDFLVRELRLFIRSALTEMMAEAEANLDYGQVFEDLVRQVGLRLPNPASGSLSRGSSRASSRASSRPSSAGSVRSSQSSRSARSARSAQGNTGLVRRRRGR